MCQCLVCLYTETMPGYSLAMLLETLFYQGETLTVVVLEMPFVTVVQIQIQLIMMLLFFLMMEAVRILV